MIEIYTDGSCWPNPSANGGWSFVVYENGHEICTFSGKADSLTSSNRMEQTAMLRALLWLGDRAAVLHSDSRLWSMASICGPRSGSATAGLAKTRPPRRSAT